MLIATLKRRWPISTALIAGLIYLTSNYDIRGLDGLRLESRSGPSDATGLGLPGPASAMPGMGWSNSLPSGPPLPSPAQTSLWPSTSSSVPVASSALAGSGISHGTPVGLPTGYEPAVLGASGSQAVPSTSMPGSLSTGGLVKGMGSTPPKPAGIAGDWTQMLSLGEKLGILEQNQAQAGATTPAAQPVQTSGGSARDSIRIASFNSGGLGDVRGSDQAIIGLVTRLLSNFDVIAIQDIRSRRDDVLPELVKRLNSSGQKFDFMIGPRVGRTERREQFAFVFNTERIETDRFQLYTVEDPDDMLHREPLVGWFRTIGPASQDAFTFSLVNMHLDPDLVQRELEALPNLLQAVAADGRGEDDIILAGDFNASASQLEFLAAKGMRVCIEGVSSTTRGTHLLDNFVFGSASTTEYTGRAGAFDFLRHFNLSLEQALAVSEHLPIWVEFSIIEGGRPGQVAGNAPPVHRFENDYH